MTLLPIVDRELRVAARRNGTYWTRVIAALLALVILGSFLGAEAFTKTFLGGATGKYLFGTLKWMCFAFACAAGTFLTSDCLSEEKREGTLGLLFLTDLRGYDVVMGKLIATSLRSCYGLLAVFPVLGLTLMLGGVSGTEFWRTTGALSNALFFSLAAGVFISAISRDALKAMTGTLLLCVVVLGVPSLLDLWMADWDENKFTPWCTIASPIYGFYIAPASSATDFWTALAWPQAMGWLFLALASVLVPRTWQDKSTSPSARGNSFSRLFRFGGKKRRDARREKWLAKNPVVWLASRDRWAARFIRVLVALAAGLMIIFYLRLNNNQFVGMGQFIHGLLIFALFIWVAAQSCRFFVEARHNGALELMLCTPLAPADVVSGAWLALRQMFLVPAVLLLLMEGGLLYCQMEMWKGMTAGGTTVGNFPNDWYLSQTIGSLISALESILLLFALAWFGMWMGMTTKRANVAVVKTLVFVLVLPTLAFFILQIFSSFLFIRGGYSFWMQQMFSNGLEVVRDIFFIAWPAWKLRTTFREMAARGDGTHRIIKAPPAPVDPNAPPVIAG